TFERDAFGRVIAEKQGGRTIRYEYDAQGRRAVRILPGGETTRFHYGLGGALSAVEHDGHKIAIERDVLGRETRRHGYRGGVDILSGYDAMDRLVTQQVTAPSTVGADVAAVLSQRGWRYDALGRVREIGDGRWGATRYDYDSIGQLIDAHRGDYREVFE